MKNQTERAHTAHPDITQVTCLLPFSSLSRTYIKLRTAGAEVSMCFTQRHTLLSLPQESSPR